jgi:hypothetical protein
MVLRRIIKVFKCKKEKDVENKRIKTAESLKLTRFEVRKEVSKFKPCEKRLLH